jgi:hypothetical protein
MRACSAEQRTQTAPERREALRRQTVTDIPELPAEFESTEERERAHDALEAVIQRMERIDLHGGPSDIGLRDTLRNPDFGGY